MEPLKVEKFSTADRGNGLRALAPLRPGELLFRSDPLAYTVCKGSRGVVCDRCLLGYVRSALAHRSPVSAGSAVLGGCVGGARPGTPSGRGCPGAQPRTLLTCGSRGLVAADRLRAAAPGLPCRGSGVSQAQPLQLCRALLDLLTPAPPWAPVGTGGSRWGRQKGKRWAGGNLAGEQKVRAPCDD